MKTLSYQGVLPHLDIREYHSSPALSHSQLKYLEPEVAPIQFWNRSWMNPDRIHDDLQGAHINTGHLCHWAMENWDDFQRRVILIPNVKRTLKAGCIGAAPRGQLEALLTLRSKLLGMRDVQEVIREGRPEVSIYGLDHDIPIRCRPDYLSDRIEIHWKFLSRMDYLGQQIDRMRYIECLAWYRRVRRSRGLPEVRQILVLCETKAPYEIRVIEPSDYFIDNADKYCKYALRRFRELYHLYGESSWPDFRHHPQDVYTTSVGGSINAVRLPDSYERQFGL